MCRQKTPTLNASRISGLLCALGIFAFSQVNVVVAVCPFSSLGARHRDAWKAEVYEPSSSPSAFASGGGALHRCPHHKPHPVGVEDTLPPAPSPRPTWQPQAPGANDPSDPLVAINNFFHSAYAHSGVAVRPNPMIILENDYLVLFVNGTRSPTLVNSMRYHNLKMICHVPLTMFMILLPEVLNRPQDEVIPLSNTTLDSFAHFVGLVQQGLASLSPSDGRFVPGEQFERQVAIMNASLAFASSVLDSKSACMASVTAFTRGLDSDVQSNLNDAGAVQTNLLYQAMETFRAKLSPSEWANLKVILTTSHMARRASSFAQFFSRYFDVNIIQSDRFITLEELSSEEHVMTLLDTHVTDYAIGDSFFGDHWRMHEDALCHAAKLALDKLFPQSAATSPGCFAV